MKRVALAFAAGTLAFTAGPALAKPLRGGVPMETVAKILRDKGYQANLGVDDEGDPKITSSAGGVAFDVICYPNKARAHLCASIQFSTVFNLADGTSYAKVNEWNRGRRYGQAWVDEEMDPFMDMSVELERGASTELIEENLIIWGELMEKWKEHFGQ